LSWEDMEVSMRQTAEVAFRQYRLNQWVRTDGEGWLPTGALDQCFDHEARLDESRPVWVGVDMALKHDSIAVVVAQPQDGRVVVEAKIWHPDAAAMDVAAVEHHLRELHLKYRVVEFAYDPAYFQRSAEVLLDDGLPMLEFPQSTARMVPACGTLYELIVGGQLRLRAEPMFVDQLLSPAQRQTDQGWRLSKGKSKRKIDAAIAAAMAVDRATRRSSQVEPGFFAV
jgi:phage terminase large subunit-like protein